MNAPASDIPSLVIVPEARQDIANAMAWYADKQLGLHREFQRELAHAIRRIYAFPRMAAEMRPGYYRTQLRRFPYGIIHFLPDHSTIRILCIFHLHRHPDVWRSRT